ncbi:MAG TPA: TetR/AcrR family transcriptional regulator, partial [Solirubrobacteraceae bacterium]
HFQDKVDLLEDWLLESRRDLLEAARAWHDADPSLGRDELRTALAGLVHTYRARMALMGAAHEIALYDAGLREDFAEAFEEHFAGLRRHIAAGQRAGDVVADLPAAETAEWLVVMLERAPPNLPRDASDREIAAHVDAVTEIVWDTLYAGAPNRARGTVGGGS